MALVHEELYQSESISDIDFATYLRTISEELYISYASGPNKPELIIESENIYLGIDQAIPCGLILNELLTNSLKYAFPGRSDNKINVTLCASGNGEITLTISDNGIGLPENINIENISSLGLQLVSVLIKQIHGSYRIDRRNGTSWMITFPAHLPSTRT
jgi:two-component sensor histidine kinase